MIDIASYRSQTDIFRGFQNIRAVAIFIIEVECQELWIFFKSRMAFWLFFRNRSCRYSNEMYSRDESNDTIFNIKRIENKKVFSQKPGKLCEKNINPNRKHAKTSDS